MQLADSIHTPVKLIKSLYILYNSLLNTYIAEYNFGFEFDAIL